MRLTGDSFLIHQTFIIYFAHPKYKQIYIIANKREYLAKIISELRATLPKRNDYARRTVELLATQGKTYSKQQVYNILTGRYHNTDVAEAFISVVEIEKKRVTALEARATAA